MPLWPTPTRHGYAHGEPSRPDLSTMPSTCSTVGSALGEGSGENGDSARGTRFDAAPLRVTGAWSSPATVARDDERVVAIRPDVPALSRGNTGRDAERVDPSPPTEPRPRSFRWPPADPRIRVDRFRSPCRFRRKQCSLSLIARPVAGETAADIDLAVVPPSDLDALDVRAGDEVSQGSSPCIARHEVDTDQLEHRAVVIMTREGGADHAHRHRRRRAPRGQT